LIIIYFIVTIDVGLAYLKFTQGGGNHDSFTCEDR